MNCLSLTDIPLKNQKVLVRVDFNVPLDKDGKITDLTRIKESLPTIKYILEQEGIVILLSHLGRPKGKKEKKYSLEPCATALSSLLNHSVSFAHDCLGEQTKKQVASLKAGDVLLLENLRFYEGEEHPKEDPLFAKALASYGDVYINDAFGTAHRKHASTYEIAAYFKEKAAAGFLIQKELKALSSLQNHPTQPFHVIIGGAKISSKIGVLTALTDAMQALYIGGAMAFTFFKALGHSIGDSLYEPDHIQTAKEILELCKEKNIALFLPVDLTISNGNTSKVIDAENKIEKGWKGVDVGPKTTAKWETELGKACSIFWNGPLGVFEDPSFAKGTFQLARFLATLSSIRVVGGGDSVAAIEKLELSDKFSHISTGGGASLELLEKGSLPGIEALSKKKI